MPPEEDRKTVTGSITSSGDHFEVVDLDRDIFFEHVLTPLLHNIKENLTGSGLEVHLREEVDGRSMGITEDGREKLFFKISLVKIDSIIGVKLLIKRPINLGYDTWEEVLSLNGRPLRINEVTGRILGEAIYPWLSM